MPRFASHSGRSFLIRSRIRFSSFCGDASVRPSTVASHNEQFTLGILRSLRRELHMKIVNEERPTIGLLLDDLRGGLPGAMSRLRFDADQHGLRPALGRLQRGGILERMAGHDAI